MDPAVLNDEIALLAALQLFEGFERDALRLIAFAADTRIVRAGDVLFRRGEIADAAFLMLSGTVVLDAADDGSPSDAVFGRGALLGQMALLAETRRAATAVMREPGAILKITRTLMRRVLDTYPDRATDLQRRLARELASTLESVQSVVRKIVDEEETG